MFRVFDESFQSRQVITFVRAMPSRVKAVPWYPVVGDRT